jgi:hypothetical protein
MRGAFGGPAAFAHAVRGDRVFPVTLPIDDPGVADELTPSVGVELLIPANRAAGTNVGVIAQFHMFLDDLLPGSVLGRPLFDFRGVPMHPIPILAPPVPA